MNYPEFESNRLLLRPTSLDDAAFILQVFNSPKWLKFIGDRNVHSEAEASVYIRNKMLSQYERLGYSTFTVIRRSDLAKMGIVGLYDREGVDGIDIGFAFLPQYEGRGYAFEAAGLLIELAFSRFGLTEIKAITTRYNFASQKLLEKLGMTQSGTLTLPADNEELLVYTIQKSK